MPYLSDLEWMNALDDLSVSERKVLLALSHSEHKWRGREPIGKLTHITGKRLDRTLAGLLEAGLIRPGFSKDRQVVYGLEERVA